MAVRFFLKPVSIELRQYGIGNGNDGRISGLQVGDRIAGAVQVPRIRYESNRAHGNVQVSRDFVIFAQQCADLIGGQIDFAKRPVDPCAAVGSLGADHCHRQIAAGL